MVELSYHFTCSFVELFTALVKHFFSAFSTHRFPCACVGVVARSVCFGCGTMVPVAMNDVPFELTQPMLIKLSFAI